MTARRVRTGALLLAVVVSVGACSSGAKTAARARRDGDTGTVASVTAGQHLGWHTMAYLASNRPSVTIQVGTTAPAALVVDEPTKVEVYVRFIDHPVWVAVTPRHATVQQRSGRGRIFVSTVGCRRNRDCTRKALHVMTGSPIPRVPPGGIVVRDGIQLRIDSHGVEPGRYDFTLPVRYPSSEQRRAILDARDTLHVRIDVSSTGPPPQQCTPADLHRRSRVISPADAVTDTIAVEGGSTRLDPAAPGFKPRVSAERAREKLAATFVSGGGGSVTLVLASLSEAFPRAPVGGVRDGHRFPTAIYETRPEIHNEVAWVLYTQHIAVNADSFPRPAPNPNAPPRTIPPNACFFSDGLSAIDATTGKELGSSGGTASPDPINF